MPNPEGSGTSSGILSSDELYAVDDDAFAGVDINRCRRQEAVRHPNDERRRHPGDQGARHPHHTDGNTSLGRQLISNRANGNADSTTTIATASSNHRTPFVHGRAPGNDELSKKAQLLNVDHRGRDAVFILKDVTSKENKLVETVLCGLGDIDHGATRKSIECLLELYKYDPGLVIGHIKSFGSVAPSNQSIAAGNEQSAEPLIAAQKKRPPETRGSLGSNANRRSKKPTSIDDVGVAMASGTNISSQKRGRSPAPKQGTYLHFAQPLCPILHCIIYASHRLYLLFKTPPWPITRPLIYPP